MPLVGCWLRRKEVPVREAVAAAMVVLVGGGEREGIEKKGMMEKIKEKLPGGHQ